MKVEVASKFALGKVPLTRHAIPHQASLFLMPAAHQTCTPQNPHELSTITPGICSTSEQLHLTPVNLVMIVPMPVHHPSETPVAQHEMTGVLIVRQLGTCGRRGNEAKSVTPDVISRTRQLQ